MKKSAEKQKPAANDANVLKPENDAAVQSAKIGQEHPKMSEADANKIIKEDAALKKDIQSGETIITSSNAPADLSVLAKPMVHNPIGGKPVYETSEQARLALAAEGNLATPK